jgi:phage tail sheath protein FI
VRRLFIFIEESIEQGTKWLVFEPNNEKLWSRHVSNIRVSVKSVETAQASRIYNNQNTTDGGAEVEEIGG